MSNSAITFGQSTVTSSNIVWSEQVAFRNKIINGNFDIWQRGTADTALSQGYLADRWGHNQFQNGLVTQQPLVVSGEHPGNSRFVARVSGDATAATSRLSLDQGIELANTIPLRGKTITASFYVRFSAASLSSTVSWNAELGYSNTSNDGSFLTTDYTASDVSRLSIFNGNYPTTWKKYTISIPVGLSAQNIALRFRFNDLTDRSTSEWYEISQVQVEEGTIATPFEHRIIGGELVLCQRYYEQSGDDAIGGIGKGYVYSLSKNIINNNFASYGGTKFSVKKIKTPIVTLYGVDTVGASANTVAVQGNSRSAIAEGITRDGFRRIQNTSGVDWLDGNDLAYNWVADAEL